MKKVRFETPDNGLVFTKMSDSECHSPRPLLEKQAPASPPEIYQYTRTLPYSNDPVQRYECSNSSPYPMVIKTCLPAARQHNDCSPSYDLDLSMLDISNHQPRQPLYKPILKTTGNRLGDLNIRKESMVHDFQPVLSSVENKINNPPNILSRDNGFFIRRDNLNKFCVDFNPVQNQLISTLSLDKENNPIQNNSKMKNVTSPHIGKQNKQMPVTINQALVTVDQNCMCHHCIKTMPNIECRRQQNNPYQKQITLGRQSQCSYIPQPACVCCKPVKPPCHSCNDNSELHTPKPLNVLERKYKAMQMYEQSKECTAIETQTNIAKEKREPTVSDLFKIIKLQNEQLQLLQEKVDKFLTGTQNVQTVQNNVEYRALQNEHKISIGVMTSFEMVRTSTIINKEVVKQTNENSQIQCNRSQISIKEVVSKQPVMNFLDGIAPMDKNMQVNISTASSQEEQQNEVINDDKTLNELSLHNVHVDNAITPLMSPDQSLYLDVKDYSDSETSSIDQSNVGWTYYNKVMTHVNGMLQDSDMPSSASALCRNTRQQCVQMQIDKTNVSVTKRVKFGDDPLGIHQPHIYAASTDTSLKMNQLAAKYLKGHQPQVPQRPAIKPTVAPFDMSFATKNYMERHKLLQGNPISPNTPPHAELPRFLDITALKQQPKLI